MTLLLADLSLDGEGQIYGTPGARYGRFLSRSEISRVGDLDGPAMLRHLGAPFPVKIINSRLGGFWAIEAEFEELKKKPIQSGDKHTSFIPAASRTQL